MSDEASARRRWSEEETVLALYLYFQLPFGKLHSRNPEIQQLATVLGRSNGSVAMKLVNFASLDPNIIASGRKGLDGASKLDRAVYAQFGQDWSGLVLQAETMWERQIKPIAEGMAPLRLKENKSEFRFEPFEGDSVTQALVAQRIGQGFFRRAVLANYDGTCCITGIADPRLLIASHIKPWGIDVENRHNPANGILLSATFDKAFDRGLITIRADRRVCVSRELKQSPSSETRAYFKNYEDALVRSAVRFEPDIAFLDWHNRNCFVD